MNDPHSIRAVIFDMDGLIFDTERISLPAWRKAGEEYGYFLDEEVLISTVGFTARDTGRILKERYGAELPYEQIRNRMFDHLREDIERNGMPVKSGFRELAVFLEGKAVRKALATSTERQRAEANLRFAGLLGSFDAVICGDEVTHGKPAPDIFLKAAERLGAIPGECLVLEDSTNGIKAAAAAGMFPILIPDLKAPPPEVERLAWKKFSSLHEVRALLETRPDFLRQEGNHERSAPT